MQNSVSIMQILRRKKTTVNFSQAYLNVNVVAWQNDRGESYDLIGAAKECAKNVGYWACGYTNLTWVYFNGHFYDCDGSFPENCTAKIRVQQEPNYCDTNLKQCNPGERVACENMNYGRFYDVGPGSDIVCDNDCRLDSQLGGFCDVPLSDCGYIQSCQQFGFLGSNCSVKYPDCSLDKDVPIDLNSCVIKGCIHP